MDFLTYENQLREDYKYNPIDINIGFYALCSYQPKAWDCVFESIRKFYPDASIVLINDGLEQYDYTEMAKKYNCIHISKNERLCLHFKTMDKADEFLYRTKEACDKLQTEWVIHLHPDVLCRHKISYYPPSELCGVSAGSSSGVSGNNWDRTDELRKVKDYIRKIQPNIELNGWGWCGGGIMLRSAFNKVYDSLYGNNKKFSIEEIIKNTIKMVYLHEDSLFPVLFALNGFPYRIWKDNPEYHRENKQGAFLHGFKEHYDMNKFNEYVNKTQEYNKNL
jgi:hypothetical protein